MYKKITSSLLHQTRIEQAKALGDQQEQHCHEPHSRQQYPSEPNQIQEQIENKIATAISSLPEGVKKVNVYLGEIEAVFWQILH